jgi:hypothetical protein
VSFDDHQKFQSFYSICILGDFSHITRDQCISKFDPLTNENLRSHLIERCNRLLTLTVRWTDDQSRLKEADLISYHSIHMPSNNLPKLERKDNNIQLFMFLKAKYIHPVVMIGMKSIFQCGII